MMEFIEVPASNASLALRKRVHGVGINDANYKVHLRVNGKAVDCPYYRTWKSMLSRCYSEKHKAREPAYHGCSVCVEWLTFSKFKRWMEKQEWRGMELDKDILIQGNKIYSPSTCIFVSRQINSLLVNCKRGRGSFAQGVNFRKSEGKFQAKCNLNGKSHHLGLYKTEKEAFLAYMDFKYKAIGDAAANQIEPLRSALLNYVIDGDWRSQYSRQKAEISAYNTKRQV